MERRFVTVAPFQVESSMAKQRRAQFPLQSGRSQRRIGLRRLAARSSAVASPRPRRNGRRRTRSPRRIRRGRRPLRARRRRPSGTRLSRARHPCCGRSSPAIPRRRELHERVRLYLNVCDRHMTPRAASPSTPEERVFAATLAVNAGNYDEALEHLRARKLRIARPRSRALHARVGARAAR